MKLFGLAYKDTFLMFLNWPVSNWQIIKEWSPKMNRTRHAFLLTSPARTHAERVFALGFLFENDFWVMGIKNDYFRRGDMYPEYVLLFYQFYSDP